MNMNAVSRFCAGAALGLALLVVRLDDDEARRIGDRQLGYEHGIDHAEDRDRRRDADRERDDRDEGEQEIAAERRAA